MEMKVEQGMKMEQRMKWGEKNGWTNLLDGRQRTFSRNENSGKFFPSHFILFLSNFHSFSLHFLSLFIHILILWFNRNRECQVVKRVIFPKVCYVTSLLTVTIAWEWDVTNEHIFIPRSFQVYEFERMGNNPFYLVCFSLLNLSLSLFLSLLNLSFSHPLSLSLFFFWI